MQYLTATLLSIYWAAMLLATHWPRGPQLDHYFNSADKVVHCLGYGLFTALLAFNRHAWSAVQGQELTTWSARWSKITIIVVLYSAFDEATQPLFMRHADVLDWLADMLGAAVVATILEAWHRSAQRR